MPYLLNPCPDCGMRHYTNEDCPKPVTKTVTRVTKPRDITPRNPAVVTKERDAPATGRPCPCCGQIVKPGPVGAAERQRRSRARRAGQPPTAAHKPLDGFGRPVNPDETPADWQGTS
jgi:hypothetical protein